LILATVGAVALNFIFDQMIDDRTTMIKAINDTAVSTLEVQSPTLSVQRY
jgi:hypothetical protein